MYRLFCGLVTLLVFYCLVATPAFAQTPPDAEAITTARETLGASKCKEAITQLENFRQKYPDSRYISEGTVLLFQAYLMTGDLAKAQPLWTEVMTKWPKSEAVWMVVEANCETKAKTSPGEALKKLTQVTEQDVLSPVGQTKAMGLRFKYLGKLDPPKSITEGLAYTKDLSGVTTKDELLVYGDLIRTLYLPLVQANRIDDARALTKRFQEKAAMMGNPDSSIEFDYSAWINALSQGNAEIFRIEAKKAINAAQWIESANEAQAPLYAARQLYIYYTAKGLFDDAKACHEMLQKGLIAAKLTDLAHGDDQEYINTRLQAMQTTNPKAYAAEAMEFLAQIKTLQSAGELMYPITIARNGVIQGLVKAGRTTEARQLCLDIQEAITRVKGNLLWMNDVWDGYFQTLYNANLKQFSTEAMDAVAAAQTAKSGADMFLPLMVAPRLYNVLFSDGRCVDARSVHTHIQDGVARVGNHPEWAAEDSTAYYTAMQQAQPKLFLTEVIPLLSAIPATPTEGLTQVALARLAYAPLATAGRMLEAKGIHERVKAFLGKQPDSIEQIIADDDAYRNCLPQVSVDGFYAMFKKALAENDPTEAKKWLDKMNEVSPEDPKSIQARKMYQQATKKD